MGRVKKNDLQRMICRYCKNRKLRPRGRLVMDDKGEVAFNLSSRCQKCLANSSIKRWASSFPARRQATLLWFFRSSEDASLLFLDIIFFWRRTTVTSGGWKHPASGQKAFSMAVPAPISTAAVVIERRAYTPRTHRFYGDDPRSNMGSEEPAKAAMLVADSGVSAPLVDALAAAGITSLTPVQEQSLPHLMAGRDILAKAKTGTGKTMAFLLPTVQNLINSREAAAAGGGQQLPSGADPIRAIVLSSARELASQILVQAGLLHWSHFSAQRKHFLCGMSWA